MSITRGPEGGVSGAGGLFSIVFQAVGRGNTICIGFGCVAERVDRTADSVEYAAAAGRQREIECMAVRRYSRRRFAQRA